MPPASVTSVGSSTGLTVTSKRASIYELRERVDIGQGLKLLSSAKMRKMREEDQSTWAGIAGTVHVAEYLGGFVTVQCYMDSEQEGFGRMKAQVLAEGKQAVPYVRMKRVARAHLAQSLYWDVDMVNAQPHIFSQALSRHSIPSPLLDRYIENRDGCIEEVMTACGVPRKDAKTLFIRLMFFGGVEGWVHETPGVDASSVPQWIHELKEEMRRNANDLLTSDELDRLRKHYVNRSMLHDLTAAASHNKTGSMMALYLQTCERECICALVEAIQADTRAVGGIIYDGVLVEKEGPEERELDQRLLTKWATAIRKATGFLVKLEVKDMDADMEWIAPPDGEDGQEHGPSIWDDTWMDGSSILSYESMKQKWELRSFKIVKGANYVREEHDERVVMSEHDLINSYRHLSYDEVTRQPHGAISPSSRVGSKTRRSGSTRRWSWRRPHSSRKTPTTSGRRPTSRVTYPPRRSMWTAKA